MGEKSLMCSRRASVTNAGSTIVRAPAFDLGV